LWQRHHQSALQLICPKGWQLDAATNKILELLRLQQQIQQALQQQLQE
jgi:hypothetical protein